MVIAGGGISGLALAAALQAAAAGTRSGLDGLINNFIKGFGLEVFGPVL